MKKKLVTLIACMSVIVMICACGKSEKEPSEAPTAEDNTDGEKAAGGNDEQVEEFSGMANPMVESDYGSIMELTGSNAVFSEDEENPQYFIISGELGNVQYTMNGGSREMDFRVQKADEFTDISGMYFDWTEESENDLYGWPYKEFGTRAETGDVRLALWYDEGNRIMYSLSAMGADLDGYDIYADVIALFPFDPPLEFNPSNDLEVRVGKTEFESYDEIIGLLEGTEAYALVHVKGYNGEVLLVADDVFDNLDGNLCAIAATAYTIKSSGLAIADTFLSSQGTAYPLSMDAEGDVYTAGHSMVEIYAYGENGTENVGLMIMKTISASEFDEEGEPSVVSGFYRKDDNVTQEGDDTVFYEGTEVDALFEAFEEYEKTTPIGFTAVDGRKATENN